MSQPPSIPPTSTLPPPILPPSNDNTNLHSRFDSFITSFRKNLYGVTVPSKEMTIDEIQDMIYDNLTQPLPEIKKDITKPLLLICGIISSFTLLLVGAKYGFRGDRERAAISKISHKYTIDDRLDLKDFRTALYPIKNIREEIKTTVVHPNEKVQDLYPTKKVKTALDYISMSGKNKK